METDAALERRARAIFGLNDLDQAPPALPMRVESWGGTDQFAATVPHTGSIMIAFGRDADMDALNAAVAAIAARHEALRSKLAVEKDRTMLLPAAPPPKLAV